MCGNNRKGYFIVNKEVFQNRGTSAFFRLLIRKFEKKRLKRVADS